MEPGCAAAFSRLTACSRTVPAGADCPECSWRLLKLPCAGRGLAHRELRRGHAGADTDPEFFSFFLPGQGLDDVTAFFEPD